MFGYGFGLGILAGLLAGAALVRYGMGLAEKLYFGKQDGVPVLSAYDAPLEQSHTNGTISNEQETEMDL